VLWHRLLGGQCLSLADYVRGTGATDGAAATGRPSCCLCSDDLPLDESPATPLTPERQVELLRAATIALGGPDPRRAFSLREAPPERPTAELSATVLETIEDARQRLGAIPKFVLYWRRGSDVTPRGEAGWDDDGALAMWLDAAMPLAAARQTVTHEAQHVADLASGRPFSHAELERRAATFAGPFGAK
jgi:hypothetical protein